jgi:putative flippase GtrA
MTPPRSFDMVAQFLRFGVVGTVGFVVDTVVLYTMMAFGAGPYVGRIPAYLTAATTTWALNRRWTFRVAGGGTGRQWATFVLLNLGGFVLNYGTFAALVRYVPAVAEDPVIGVAAGALAGMVVNFLLSRRYVFRQAVAR